MIRAEQSATRWQAGRSRTGPSRPTLSGPVPFDYGARFVLTGRLGNVLEDALVIAPDGVFVAVAIGYGLAEARDRPLPVRDAAAAPLAPADLTLADIPTEALLEGFRVAPREDNLVFATALGGAEPEFAQEALAPAQLNRVLRRVKPRAELSFLFSIVDSATGRELQDEPTHNLASLGIATGERPFRLLANPISFLPRSTVRLQVIEQTPDVLGTLFIVLYGYRIPFRSDCPEPTVRSLARPTRTGRLRPALPPTRVVPFDYVATVDLAGVPENRVESEIVVNVEGEYVATSIGYGISVDDPSVRFGRAGNQPVDLGAIRLGDFPPLALRDGIRIRPELVRIAFQDNGVLANALPAALLDRLFERLNRPQDVSFVYSIFDSGRGHDLQNIGLNNVAGLGSAGGERPFKRFAAPLRLAPRTTLRVEVVEQYGRGRLFVVFQGYKILSAPAAGSAR